MKLVILNLLAKKDVHFCTDNYQKTLVYQNNPFQVFIFFDSIQWISFIIYDNVCFRTCQISNKTLDFLQ